MKANMEYGSVPHIEADAIPSRGEDVFETDSAQLHVYNSHVRSARYGAAVLVAATIGAAAFGIAGTMHGDAEPHEMSALQSNAAQSASSEFDLRGPDGLKNTQDSLLQISAQNEYEREAGRQLADGVYAYEHLVEMHQATEFAIVTPSASCEYTWTYTENDELQQQAGPVINITFTQTGWQKVTLTATCTTADDADNAQPIQFTRSFDIMSKYVRREIRALKDQDRERFFDALQVVYTSNLKDGQAMYGKKFRTISQLVSKHLEGAADKECDHWHDDAGMMTHHMAFTLEMEQAIQSVDPTVCIPYWDYTWDRYLIDNSTIKDFTYSQLFGDDWFGTASPVNEDHVVDSGRWGFLNLAKDDGQGHLQIKNPYGLLRSPWNTNNVPYLTRSRYTYNQKDGGWSLPSCAEFAQFFDEKRLSEFMYVLNGELHGPIHVMVGGQWWMNETSTINSTFGGEFLLSSKYMWRQGLIRCPETCAADTPKEHCACSCPSEIWDVQGTGLVTSNTVLKEFGILELTTMFNAASNIETIGMNCDNVGGCYDMLMENLCHVGHAGEMFTSAAPYDPLFWVVHGMAERYLSFKRYAAAMGNSTLDESWGYTHGQTGTSNTVASDTNVICDWSDVQEGTYDMPNCTKGTCPGHKADDLIPFTDFMDRGESYTNEEFYTFTDPTNDDLPYTYDTYTYWAACEEEGITFDNMHTGENAMDDDYSDPAQDDVVPTHNDADDAIVALPSSSFM